MSEFQFKNNQELGETLNALARQCPILYSVDLGEHSSSGYHTLYVTDCADMTYGFDPLTTAVTPTETIATSPNQDPFSTRTLFVGPHEYRHILACNSELSTTSSPYAPYKSSFILSDSGITILLATKKSRNQYEGDELKRVAYDSSCTVDEVKDWVYCDNNLPVADEVRRNAPQLMLADLSAGLHDRYRAAARLQSKRIHGETMKGFAKENAISVGLASSTVAAIAITEALSDIPPQITIGMTAVAGSLAIYGAYANASLFNKFVKGADERNEFPAPYYKQIADELSASLMSIYSTDEFVSRFNDALDIEDK